MEKADTDGRGHRFGHGRRVADTDTDADADTDTDADADTDANSTLNIRKGSPHQCASQGRPTVHSG